MSEVDNEENFEGLSPEEQMDKMKAALERYKKENAKFREQRDEWKSKYEESLSSDETLNMYKDRTTRAEAKVLLQKEGIKDADRILNRMDFANVTIDESGEVKGLNEQIESIKSDLPELFNHRKRVGGGADGSNRGSAPSLTPTEQAVRRIFHK